MNTSSSNKASNLSKLSPKELVKRDVFGRTILHVVILANRYDLLRNLFKNTDVGLIITCVDYENAWNCLHYIVFHKRLACFKVLLDSIKATSVYTELVRAKDRNGQTPAQLLMNDFKDLVWIPEYINEDNECHLLYRYKGRSKNIENVSTTASDSNSVAKLDKSSKRNQVDKFSFFRRSSSEIHVLGSNHQNQLGVGDHKDRTIPTKLLHTPFKPDIFSTSSLVKFLKPRYLKLCISKHHSVVLTQDGNIFSAGMGSMGRLGLGNTNNYSNYKLIDFFSKLSLSIIDVSISNNHSIVLTLDNEVYGWGLNSCGQLGYISASCKDYKNVFDQKPISILGDLKYNSNKLKGIATSNIHSVVFTNSELFFWGLNIGQMGVPSDSQSTEFTHDGVTHSGEILKNPRSVSLRDEIKLMDTCDVCTVLVTVKNEIHVYTQFQHIKLPKIPPKGSSVDQFSVFKPARLTKPIEITKIVLKSHKFCAILLSAGDVFILKLDVKDVKDFKNIKYTQVWSSYGHEMNVMDVDVSEDGSLILCTRNGAVFVKSSTLSYTKSTLTDVMQQLPNVKNKFKKLHHLNKILLVVCDPKFISFGFLRDDIDMLPFELQKSEFREDVSQLSPLIKTDSSRKRRQLLDANHSLHTYISRFLYPSVKLTEYDDNIPTELNSDETFRDCLFESHYRKHDPKFSKKMNKVGTFSPAPKCVINYRPHTFQNGSSGIEHYLNQLDNKSSDCFLVLDEFPLSPIGIHKIVFQSRSNVFKEIFQTTENEFFIKEDIKVHYSSMKNELRVQGKIDINGLLVFIHFVYTNNNLLDAPDIPGVETSTAKSTYVKLARIFGFDLSYNIELDPIRYSEGLRATIPAKKFNDVLVQLSDGQMWCNSSILKTRSAFFETILSDRWEADSVLNFPGISSTQFNFVLQFLYGKTSTELFDLLEYQFDETDEFVNAILEIIEISDELLLFQLKVLCEMVISDFIDMDNVTLLLLHAENLSCFKLFMNCCWYIYNNLDILLFDSALNDLPLDTLRKLEKQIIFFHNCQLSEFIDQAGVINRELEFIFKLESNLIVATFVSDLSSFNEVFMSDRKGCMLFEPLVDAKLMEPVKLSIPKSRKSSGKKSMQGEIVTFRKTFTDRKDEVSAITSEADNFEVVNRGSRRKSSAAATSGTPTREVSFSKENVSISEKKFVPISKFETENIKSDASTERKTSLSYLDTGLNSKHKNDQLPLKIELEAEPSHKLNTRVKVPKSKVGPMIKLSQKERRRLNSLLNEEISNSNSESESSISSGKTPWGESLNLSASNLVQANPKGILTNDYTHVMPVLGSSKSKSKSKINTVSYRDGVAVGKSSSEALVAPSITNDSSFNEPVSIQAERKTLAEIQQEEEFNKWWAQESLKVQRQDQSTKVQRQDQSSKGGRQDQESTKGQRQDPRKFKDKINPRKVKDKINRQKVKDKINNLQKVEDN